MKALFNLLLVFFISCTEQYPEHKNLNEIAVELNSRCPLMVDDQTKFEKIKATGNQLELFFTLVKMDKDSTDIEALNKELKAFLTDNLRNGFKIHKTQLDLIFIKENNIVFHYVYLDKNSKVLSDIIIGPEDYSNQYGKP